MYFVPRFTLTPYSRIERVTKSDEKWVPIIKLLPTEHIIIEQADGSRMVLRGLNSGWGFVVWAAHTQIGGRDQGVSASNGIEDVHTKHVLHIKVGRIVGRTRA